MTLDGMPLIEGPCGHPRGVKYILELSYAYANRLWRQRGKPVVQRHFLVAISPIPHRLHLLLWLCPDERGGLDPGRAQDHGLDAGPCWAAPYRALGPLADGCRCRQTAP